MVVFWAWARAGYALAKMSPRMNTRTGPKEAAKNMGENKKKERPDNVITDWLALWKCVYDTATGLILVKLRRGG